MQLFEFQAKKILEEHGVPIPDGTLVSTLSGLRDLRYPAMVKAQVRSGGRGKAGGVVRVGDADQAEIAASGLLAEGLLGQRVSKLLVEEVIRADRELYLAVTCDGLRAVPVIIAGSKGGVEVEKWAQEAHDGVVRVYCDPVCGLLDSGVHFLAKALSLPYASFAPLVRNLVDVFLLYDAMLVEVNPLALSGDSLVALDAKIELDDNAAFRHVTLHTHLAAVDTASPAGRSTEVGKVAVVPGITHIRLDGEIALISDGAGTGLLTLDMVTDAGGRVGSFSELGAAAGREAMCHALGIALEDPQMKVVLISLIGGLTRMDDVAAGIVDGLEGAASLPPLVIRMCGTAEEEGRQVLCEAGLSSVDDLHEAVCRAVLLAQGAGQ